MWEDSDQHTLVLNAGESYFHLQSLMSSTAIFVDDMVSEIFKKTALILYIKAYTYPLTYPRKKNNEWSDVIKMYYTLFTSQESPTDEILSQY